MKIGLGVRITCKLFTLQMMEVTSKRRRWECTQCPKTYSQAGKLAYHRKRVHEGTAPVYECEFCEVRFASKYNNVRHYRVVHQQQKRFPCTECEEEFATRTSLTGHLLKVHSIGNALACEKCGKTFYHAHNLKEHVSMCGRQPNYECGICGTMFTTGRALKLHLTCKHSSKSFVCEICRNECLWGVRYGSTCKTSIKYHCFPKFSDMCKTKINCRSFHKVSDKYIKLTQPCNFDPFESQSHYENMSVQYEAISKSGKNDIFRCKNVTFFSYFCSKH